MAAGYRQNGYRRSELRTSGRMYMYGNVVPKPDYAPERAVPGSRRKKKKVSRLVRNNRRKALRMSPGYVVFIAAAALIALAICVNYIQLQSRITSYSKTIVSLQEELTEMREENNTKYNAVMSKVNLEEVRQRAEEKLGMVYAAPEQIVEYKSPSTDYVTQYEKIPKDGVLARSDTGQNR